MNTATQERVSEAHLISHDIINSRIAEILRKEYRINFAKADEKTLIMELRKRQHTFSFIIKKPTEMTYTARAMYYKRNQQVEFIDKEENMSLREFYQFILKATLYVIKTGVR